MKCGKFVGVLALGATVQCRAAEDFSASAAENASLPRPPAATAPDFPGTSLAVKKLAANHKAYEILEAIRELRSELGLPIDIHVDPLRTGLIGAGESELSSSTGDLESKRIAAENVPELAAWLVDLYERAGVKSGDRIAVFWTGSLPGFNVAVCAANEATGVQPVAISSAASSTYGANLPGFLWIDIENFLNSKGIIRFQSVAASIGGKRDKGENVDSPDLIAQSIARHNITFIKADDIGGAIQTRLDILENSLAAGEQYKLVVACGGNPAASGGDSGTVIPSDGLIDRSRLADLRKGAAVPDCAFVRMVEAGTPGIYLRSPKKLPVIVREP